MATLVPGTGFFLGQGGMWEILPPPSPPADGKFGVRRSGIYLNIYEIINPSVVITATGSMACIGGTPGPVQPSPELITGIRIDPGAAPNKQGKGVQVILGPARSLSEMILPVFNEPYVKYSSITSAPLPTLVLPAPLTGYISEKYLWDMEFGVSDLYGDTAVLQKRDNLEGIDYTTGVKKRKRPFPETRVTQRNLGAPVRGVTLNQLYPKTVAEAATIGSYSVESVAKNSSYIFNYRPSLIRRLRFFYTITVTSTCPPYTWYFPAYMDVDNNWDNHAKRVKYRVARQKGRFKP